MPTTPNMSLVLPTVSVTPGPTWATMLNAALTLVDSHDHSTGNGAPITPSSLSITSDLEFNSNDATELRSTRYESQSSALAVGTDVGALYNLSGNPTWNDNSATSSRLVNVSYPMVAGDMIYASSTTAFGRLGIGSTGQILKVAGGLPSWASQGATLTVVSKTTTYTIASSDDVILADDTGASFTMTLPVSTGGGKTYVIKKTNSTFANAVTIARAAADTIQDAGATVTSTTLNTQGEEIYILDASVGAWQILSRRVPSIMLAYVPGFSGFGTVASAAGFWKRIGDSVLIQAYWVNGTVAASLGTIFLPTGLVMDSAKIGVANANTTRGQAVGTYASVIAAGFGSMITATGSSTTGIYFGDIATGGNTMVPRNGTVIGTNAESMACTFTVPISGWNA